MVSHMKTPPAKNTTTKWKGGEIRLKDNDAYVSASKSIGWRRKTNDNSNRRTNMSELNERCTGHRITVEAVGLTQGHAAAYALRLLADMIQAPTLQGHSCGGYTGNASGKWEKIPLGNKEGT